MVRVEWQNFLPRLLGRRGDLPSLGGIRNVHGVVDIATGLSSWRRGGSFSQGGFRGMSIAGWAGSGSIPGVKQAWGHHCHLAPATFPLRTAEALDFLQTLLIPGARVQLIFELHVGFSFGNPEVCQVWHGGRGGRRSRQVRSNTMALESPRAEVTPQLGHLP